MAIPLNHTFAFLNVFQLGKDLSDVLLKQEINKALQQQQKQQQPHSRMAGVGATKNEANNNVNSAVTSATLHHKDSSITHYKPPPVFEPSVPAGLGSTGNPAIPTTAVAAPPPPPLVPSPQPSGPLGPISGPTTMGTMGPPPPMAPSVVPHMGPPAANTTDGETTIVKVTSPTISHSFGSFLNTINKSVSSALNSIMSFQQPGGQDLSTGLKQEPAPPSVPKVVVGRGATASSSTPAIASATSAPDINTAPPQVRAASTIPTSYSSMPGGPMSAHSPAPISPYPQPPHRIPPSPSFSRARSRSPSPRQDVGFASAVTNICDQAHEIARERRSGSRHSGEWKDGCSLVKKLLP